jgi:hypothetical protein
MHMPLYIHIRIVRNVEHNFFDRPTGEVRL